MEFSRGQLERLFLLRDLLREALSLREKEVKGNSYSKAQALAPERPVESKIGRDASPPWPQPAAEILQVLPDLTGKPKVEPVPERLRGRCYQELLILEQDGGLSADEKKWFSRRKLGKYLAS